eukprot:1398080-Pleurochrysis_carterae.AAC.1
MAWEAAVGGGAVPVADTVGGVDTILITAETLPIGSLAAQVGCATAGAIATFIGTTRNTFEGKRVLRLESAASESGECEPDANSELAQASGHKVFSGRRAIHVICSADLPETACCRCGFACLMRVIFTPLAKLSSQPHSPSYD